MSSHSDSLFQQSTSTLYFTNSQFLQDPEKNIVKEMASVSMAMPSVAATSSSVSRQRQTASDAFFKPLHVKGLKVGKVANSKGKRRVEASMKEKAVAGITAAVVVAMVGVPEVAQAAAGVLEPSLKNFLLSIAVGGAVLGVIAGAVFGLANFDPVNRS